MGIWEIVVGALVLIFSVIMIIVIILQEGHDSGLGTITGGADSFLKRGKAKTADALFAKVTKYCAIAFFVCVVLLNALSYFGLTGKPEETAEVPEVSVSSEISEEVSDESQEDSEEVSTEESAEEASETSTEESAEEVSETSTEESAEEVSETSTEESAEEESETSIEESAEEESEVSSEE